MTLTLFQVFSITFSIISILTVGISLPIAWGKLQQWKKNIDKEIDTFTSSIKELIEEVKTMNSIINDIDDCVDDLRELKSKLYTSDGTPSYTTDKVCKNNMERINENFATYREFINDKLVGFKGDIDHLSRMKPEFESMYTILGKIIERLDEKRDH